MTVSFGGRASSVRFEGVTKRFGDIAAVDDVSFVVEAGTLVTLLGPSGCGKTTTLRLVAGLELATAGRILIGDHDVTGLPATRRDVSMVFQSYALFPHMTVEQNVAFGLKREGLPKGEIKDRVRAMLEMVELGRFAGRKPHQMSGGQRQRVALARGLVKLPKVLLLDEPLAALDKKLREKTQFELVNLQEKIGITFIMVTHDQEEAMTMSGRIGVMDAGSMQQVGTPSEIYEYPANRFVADFIGAANFFEGTLESKTAQGAVIHCPELGHAINATLSGLADEGSPVTVMVRPEKMRIVTDESPDDGGNRVRGVITDIGYLGDMSIFHVRLDSGRILQTSQLNFQHTAEQKITWDDEVTLSWHPDNAVVLVR